MQKKSIGQRVCKGDNIPFKQTEVTASARECLAESEFLSILTFFLTPFLSFLVSTELPRLSFPHISPKK